MATTYHTQLQQLYVAYFNRPADYAGLNYWETLLEGNGGDISVVSAAFAASAEYEAEYDDLSTAARVNKIYQNLFGRDAEPEGLVYWTNLLNAGTYTIDNVVNVIAAAAVTNGAADGVAFKSKVAFATAFTNELTTAELQAGYTGDLANEAAKEVLSTIKTDADLSAAVAPAKLAEHVNAVVDAATPFTLVSGLEALAEAQADLAAFLVTADGDDDEDTDTSKLELEADVETAADALDDAALVPGYDLDRPAVSAALLAEEVEDRAAALEEAQGDYAEAVEDADEVDGLMDAIAALEAAGDAVTAAAAAEVNASAALAAAAASYEVKNTTVDLDVELTVDLEAETNVVTFVNAEAEVEPLIVRNGDGELELAEGVDEDGFEGITALLNAAKAFEAAAQAVVDAGDAQDDAQFVVDILDLDEAEEAAAALAAVGGGFTVTSPADEDAPTPVEILNERIALEANVAAEVAGAAAALTTFNNLVTTLEGADNANVLSEKVAEEAGDVEEAQASVDALAAAVKALTDAQALVAEYNELNTVVTEARAEFTDAGLKAPASLGLTGFAGSGSDIFVLGETATATLSGFGDAGTDHLFIGTGYVYNTGALNTGNNSALEVFMIQDGANVKVHVEGVAFGSASTAEAEQIVTLTGIQLSELTFANGIITAA